MALKNTGSNDQKKQSAEEELYKVRESLRNAEERVKHREEERQKALQKLQTSTEVRLKTYKALHNCSCLLIPSFLGCVFVVMYLEPESAVEPNTRDGPAV